MNSIKLCMVLGLTAAIAGCAEQTAMRLAHDTVRVNISTAPIYGALEPERRAMLLAAEETVKAGFDKFLIVNGASGFQRNTLGTTGGSASWNQYGGTYTGPQTIGMPRFTTELVIKMFKGDDPAGRNAVDAREILKSAPKP
jgi:hypothetical protein